jgi:hypothetical protein
MNRSRRNGVALCSPGSFFATAAFAIGGLLVVARYVVAAPAARRGPRGPAPTTATVIPSLRV